MIKLLWYCTRVKVEVTTWVKVQSSGEKTYSTKKYKEFSKILEVKIKSKSTEYGGDRWYWYVGCDGALYIAMRDFKVSIYIINTGLLVNPWHVKVLSNRDRDCHTQQHTQSIVLNFI